MKAIFIDGPLAGKCLQYGRTFETLNVFDADRKEVTYYRISATREKGTYIFSIVARPPVV